MLKPSASPFNLHSQVQAVRMSRSLPATARRQAELAHLAAWSAAPLVLHLVARPVFTLPIFSVRLLVAPFRHLDGISSRHRNCDSNSRLGCVPSSLFTYALSSMNVVFKVVVQRKGKASSSGSNTMTQSSS